MASHRTLPTILRCTALALAATAAFAGGWHSGAPGLRGGAHGTVRFGGTMRVLPRGYATYRWGGNPYYFHGGFWYRPWRGAYLGCYPPIGLFLDVLPMGYTVYTYGGVRYYDYEDVYYTDGPSGGYVVADPPPDRAPRATPPPPPSSDPAIDALIIVAKEGQTPEKMKADRAAAQRHAMQKSGYDPAYSDPSDPGTPRARRAYLRAMRNYLEARGYSVE